MQNDLGTTDAHVLVVAVEKLTVSITYTDTHLQRLAFFRDLFTRFEVEWSASEQHAARQFESGGFALTVGVYRAGDGEELRRFLKFLGSRLAFLIDWNKARKKLRPFVDKRAALDILAWAAGTTSATAALSRLAVRAPSTKQWSSPVLAGCTSATGSTIFSGQRTQPPIYGSRCRRRPGDRAPAARQR